MQPEQQNNSVPYGNFSSTNPPENASYQPSSPPSTPYIGIVPPIIPRKSHKVLGVFIVLIILAIGGLGAYKYSQGQASSMWSTDLRAWEVQYNTHTNQFLEKFGEIDLNLVTSLDSAVKMETKIVSTKESLNKVDLDVQGILNYVGPNSTTTEKLSIEELLIKNDFLSCFEGRKSGVNYIQEGLFNAHKYIGAYQELQKYYAEISYFTKYKNDVSLLMRGKNEVEIVKSLKQARGSSLTLIESLAKVRLTLDTPNIRANYDAYTEISKGFEDMIIGFERKDLKLLNSGTQKLKNGGDMIETTRGQGPEQIQAWYETNVTSFFVKGNEEFDKVADSCSRVDTFAGNRAGRESGVTSSTTPDNVSATQNLTPEQATKNFNDAVGVDLVSRVEQRIDSDGKQQPVFIVDPKVAGDLVKEKYAGNPDNMKANMRITLIAAGIEADYQVMMKKTQTGTYTNSCPELKKVFTQEVTDKYNKVDEDMGISQKDYGISLNDYRLSELKCQENSTGYILTVPFIWKNNVATNFCLSPGGGVLGDVDSANMTCIKKY